MSEPAADLAADERPLRLRAELLSVQSLSPAQGATPKNPLVQVAAAGHRRTGRDGQDKPPSLPTKHRLVVGSWLGEPATNICRGAEREACLRGRREGGSHEDVVGLC